MEIPKSSKHLPRTDILDNRASEITDADYRARYGDAACVVIKAYYQRMSREINEIYAEMGAKVLRGISYAGEDATRISVPDPIETSSYPSYPA